MLNGGRWSGWGGGVSALRMLGLVLRSARGLLDVANFDTSLNVSDPESAKTRGRQGGGEPAGDKGFPVCGNGTRG